jgi:hypothetical protein
MIFDLKVMGTAPARHITAPMASQRSGARLSTSFV